MMTDPVVHEKPEKLKKPFRWWPGVVATGWGRRNGHPRLLARQNELAGAVQGYSYRVCLKCGAMQLFDEKAFRAYGPFRYDLNQLIALQSPEKRKPIP
jgi:hypothetical protein